MSIKRDKNGYKIFDLPDGGQLLWAEEDRVLFSRPAEFCTPLTMDPDDEFDELLRAAEFAIIERNKAIQELRDYKAKRGENLGEMLDARAEADRLRKELEEEHAYRKSLVKTMFEVDEILRWQGPNGWVPARNKIMGWLDSNKDSGYLGQEGEGKQNE